jgi:hypothetical protein
MIKHILPNESVKIRRPLGAASNLGGMGLTKQFKDVLFSTSHW